MRTLLVVAHPDPDALIHGMVGCFARRLAQSGSELDLVDLYKDDFSPVVGAEEYSEWQSQAVPDEIAGYQQRLKAADNLVLAYPVWWATPPAIMQGWLQRVMTNGFAFAFDENGQRGLLSHRAGLMVNVGSPNSSNLSAQYIEPIQGVLKYCGIVDIKTCVNWGIYPDVDEGRVQQALQAAEKFAEEFV